MKVRDLIKRSLQLIGVLASGETPSASEMSDALVSLNNMIASWKLSPNIMAERTRLSFPFPAAQPFYTVGVGGDFDMERPEKITYLNYKLTSGEDYERPIEIINQQEWARVTSKGVVAAPSNYAYIEYSYPLIKIYLWPQSDGTGEAVLYVDKFVSKFTNVSNDILLSESYLEALEYNLALRLSGPYGRPLDPDSKEIAVKSLAQIKRANYNPLLMTPDTAGFGRRKPFNYRTGE